MAGLLGLLLAWLGGWGCAGRLASPWGGERPLPRARRSWVWNQFFVIEEYAGPEPVLIGRLHTDADRGENRIKYVLSGEGAGTVFVIDEHTGNIHVTKTLDREEKAQYTLLAQALDRASGRPLEPPSEFIIKVQDINDNPPVFPQGPYHATVPEMSNVGTSVIQVTAHDADDPTYGNSAKLVYTVVEGLPFFSVDPQTGVVRTAVPNMDREVQPELRVVIQAKDMGGHAGGLSGSVTVTVTLSDVNDNPPRFPQSSYEFSVPETTVPGAAVGRVRALDPDEGPNAQLSYRLLDGGAAGPFTIRTDARGQDGVLTLTQPLDFETRRSYSFRVEASNTQLDPQHLRHGPFKDVATVRVAVEDADEPPAFARPAYRLALPEDSPPGALVGQVSAADPDVPGSPIRYSIAPHSDPDGFFHIGPQDGAIRIARGLDREARAWHNLTVLAAQLDSPSQASPVPVAIEALDVNDNAPQLAPDYEPFVCASTAPGQLIQTIRALDPDEDGATRVSIRAVPGPGPTDITVRDNKDGTAALVLGARGLRRTGSGPLLVRLELADGGHPRHTSSATLTLRVCRCQGPPRACAPAAPAAPGLSTAALLAILAATTALLGLVGLFGALRRRKPGARAVPEDEDVRENIISYDDEGGGEEDTEAFDMAALQHPPGGRCDMRPRTPGPAPAPRPGPAPRHVAGALAARLGVVDADPWAPPYDSIQVYGYEGAGSPCGSLSPLGSACGDSPGDDPARDPGDDPDDDWGPLFRTLAELYGSHEGGTRP